MSELFGDCIDQILSENEQVAWMVNLMRNSCNYKVLKLKQEAKDRKK